MLPRWSLDSYVGKHFARYWLMLGMIKCDSLMNPVTQDLEFKHFNVEMYGTGPLKKYLLKAVCQWPYHRVSAWVDIFPWSALNTILRKVRQLWQGQGLQSLLCRTPHSFILIMSPAAEYLIMLQCCSQCCMGDVNCSKAKCEHRLILVARETSK